ncbi:hypothetical protein PR048_005881 [Dryococelus australis]|uniref:Uncharacterized protein n=1 Tax=Dryococelus australis TaxID=614101 RepID=A0ABQ9IAL5_9NEOP|nr:hypothetical protein PR048_005881 [Dryococelus australis]
MTNICINNAWFLYEREIGLKFIPHSKESLKEFSIHIFEAAEVRTDIYDYFPKFIARRRCKYCVKDQTFS